VIGPFDRLQPSCNNAVNRLKTMKRQAYGFRDKEFFKLKILAIHEARYELVG
jgi:hypothetical protein